MYGANSMYRNPTSPMLKLQADAFYNGTIRNARKLTPAGKRMLVKLLKVFNKRKGRPITRKHVATILKRTNLTPHDINLLNKLCGDSLIQSERVPVWTSDKRPAGSQWTYTMSEDTAWALNKMLRTNPKQ